MWRSSKNHPNKTALFFSGTWCGWATRKTSWFRALTYVDSRAAQGLDSLEVLPRTSTSHLATVRTPEADFHPLNHGLNSAWRLAQDRERWRQLVETALGHVPRFLDFQLNFSGHFRAAQTLNIRLHAVAYPVKYVGLMAYCFVAVYCMNFIIFLYVTLKLFSLRFVLLFAQILSTPLAVTAKYVIRYA